jgi:hypothetical protein
MSAILSKLPESLKSAKVLDNGNVMLPAMRMQYPALFVPVPPSKREKDPKKVQWSVTGLIPGVCDLSALEDEIKSLIDDNLTAAKQQPLRDGTLPYNQPLKDTASQQRLSDLADDYTKLIRMNAKKFTSNGQERPAPEVIDAKGHPVEEADAPDMVYPGRWFRATIRPFWYNADDGKPGVSCGLVNVQLLYNDDVLTGGKPKASSEFEALPDIDDGEDEPDAETYE